MLQVVKSRGAEILQYAVQKLGYFCVDEFFFCGRRGIDVDAILFRYGEYPFCGEVIHNRHDGVVGQFPACVHIVAYLPYAYVLALRIQCPDIFHYLRLQLPH